jgi:DNA-binding response OmpR family regulator
MTWRLLVIEDEAGIREPLVDFLTGHDFVVTAPGTTREAEAELVRGGFSLVLLDLLLPGADGLDLLRALRRRGDRTPVIVLTARGEETQRVRGLTLGADDYVVKPFSLGELVARIHAVLRRSQGTAQLRLGSVLVDLAAQEVERDGRRVRLLPKEAELLAFFLRHPGTVFGRDDLLREVWGYDATPTTRTVDTHVFQLRKKIEPDPEAPRFLVTVHGTGYRFAAPDGPEECG